MALGEIGEYGSEPKESPILLLHNSINPSGAERMSADPNSSAIQVHLAEFAELRKEVLANLDERRKLLLFSLTASGALFSFAYSGDVSTAGVRHLALYLIAPMAAVTGWQWLSCNLRNVRIGRYIRDVLAVRINSLIVCPPGKRAENFEVFEWENSEQRVMGTWKRRFLEIWVLLFTFVLSGLGAQALLLPSRPGLSFWGRAQLTEHPRWFLLDLLLSLASSVLFAAYFVYGKSYTARTRVKSEKAT